MDRADGATLLSRLWPFQRQRNREMRRLIGDLLVRLSFHRSVIILAKYGTISEDKRSYWDGENVNFANRRTRESQKRTIRSISSFESINRLLGKSFLVNAKQYNHAGAKRHRRLSKVAGTVKPKDPKVYIY
jgi:hypothetical protein